MFPLDEEKGEGLSQRNDFMGSEIHVADDNTTGATGETALSRHSDDNAYSPQQKVVVRHLTYPRGRESMLSPSARPTAQNVGQLSRLWQYRNGESPTS